MRRLTIGSLKYGGSNKNPILIDQSVAEDRPTVHEQNRVIVIKQNQRSFQVEVKKGQSVLDAALEQNVALDYRCKKGTCGKCKVQLVNGRAQLQPVNHLEEKKLNHLIQSGFRLACQAIAR